MALHVEIDFAPVYELKAAIKAYTDKKSRRLFDLGPAWADEVRRTLPDDFDRVIAAMDTLRPIPFPTVLVEHCPGEHGVESYIAWLEGLESGEALRLLAPHLRDPKLPSVASIEGARHLFIYALKVFHAGYFRTVDPAILQGLQAEAESRRALIGAMPPEDLVELVTNGFRLDDEGELERVLLVPQYHARPFNLIDRYRRHIIIAYPADVLPPAPDEPPISLMRLTRALSDESRLRILRLIMSGPRSFTELVAATGLAKSTVHHHMLALRSAGLVRVHRPHECSSWYSIRPGAVEGVSSRLGTYLQGV